MDDCVEVSRNFARRAAEELHIPMYVIIASINS